MCVDDALGQFRLRLAGPRSVEVVVGEGERKQIVVTVRSHKYARARVITFRYLFPDFRLADIPRERCFLPLIMMLRNPM